MTLTDETSYQAEQATARFQRRMEDYRWGDDELPFAAVPRPGIDWWGVLGGALAAALVIAPWFLILFRVARGVWPWQR